MRDISTAQYHLLYRLIWAFGDADSLRVFSTKIISDSILEMFAIGLI